MKRLTLLAVGFLLIGCGLDIPTIFVDPVREACADFREPNMETFKTFIRTLRDEGVSKLEMLLVVGEVEDQELCAQGLEDVLGQPLSPVEAYEAGRSCLNCMTALVDEVYSEP